MVKAQSDQWTLHAWGELFGTEVRALGLFTPARTSHEMWAAPGERHDMYEEAVFSWGQSQVDSAESCQNPVFGSWQMIAQPSGVSGRCTGCPQYKEAEVSQLNEKIYHHLLKKFLIIPLSSLKGDLLWTLKHLARFWLHQNPQQNGQGVWLHRKSMLFVAKEIWVQLSAPLFTNTLYSLWTSNFSSAKWG